jgi:hypothetical protein
MTDNFLDAWNELDGGVTSLLQNDDVMNALADIQLDEGVTAADVLTGIARCRVDVQVLLDKEMRKRND